MKNIILSIALFFCATYAINAQSTAAGSSGTVTDQKPKTAVEESKKTNAATDTASTVVMPKKPVKKSCCKKSGEGTPCNKGTATKKATGTKED